MSFCRITGRSRGLPKPNYFPLLAPISPADAKRCCRITGKSYGLPSHHYIPVLLTSRSSKTKCKITNVSGELGPHHYAPEINYGNRKHDMLPDYRYIFPVLDGSTDAQKALIELLLAKKVTEEKRYVYTVQERRCSLVFSAQMEAAVRDGDVRDVMLAKDSDTVLIKTKHGRSVSMDFKDFTEDVEMFEGEGPNADVLKQRELEEIEEKKRKRKRASGLSSMKKIFENKEKLAEVEEIEEENQRKVRKAKKTKFDENKHDVKSFTCNNFSVNHMRSKSSIAMSSGEWRDHVHPLMETWDWEAFEKEIVDEHIVPKVTHLPTPIKITPYQCESEIYEVDRNINDVSIQLENVPCVNPLKPTKTKPSETILCAVKEISEEHLAETSDVVEKLMQAEKMDMLPTMDNLPELIKNIKKGKKEKIAKISGLTLDINKAKKFVPGQHINTPQGPVFVPGQTVETPVGPIFVPGLTVTTPSGPGLIPGHVLTNDHSNEPFFVAGQVVQTANGEEFIAGQTIETKEGSYRFTEGQTVLSEEGLKFVPGKVINNGSDEVFVPGQTILAPEGAQFIPGQTLTEKSGITFTPGQNTQINNEWQFVPGQVIRQDDDFHFIPGATLATPNGLKFVPGQTVDINGETCFVPGITKSSSDNTLEFVPGTIVDTIDGSKFIEGQIVKTECGEKFVPGKTIVQGNGSVEFSIAKSIKDITFTESTATGLPIDIKTSSLSEESLYVFGHMIQTAKGIEFYPGPRIPKIEGKVVPGRLVKNEANESRFVPGMMVEGVFVPGQIVFTENGEQFVPGQVVDTADGPKFVPGQVVNTKTGPKFVPGQTIHTIDGPRFVPGQIIETKAGPTFIPGQVISTEDEGSRFVPGQVVDTEEGPRFVPGRVIETDDNGVTFVPGQIVQTPEGLKFIAPDLTEGEEGLEFSVQSFVVTPEELKLLKVKTNPNDTTSTKGELTIDKNMLKQLSEAGMSIGRQVPAEIPAINVILNETRNAEVLKAFVTDFGLKDEVANQLMEVIKSIIEMSAHLKTEIHEDQHSDTSSCEMKKSRPNKKRMIEIQEGPRFTDNNGHTAHHEHVKNSIAAAVLAALVTAEQFEEVNNNNSKEKYQLILKSIDTILGKAIDENFVSAMYKILQTEEKKDVLREEILENTSQPKVELIKIAVNSALHKHSYTTEDIAEKFGDFLSSVHEVLGPAFKNIAKSDNTILPHVLSHISESISFIKTDHEATESLRKAIVSAIQENSTKEVEAMLNNSDKRELKELIEQSIGLAKILGMRDVANNLHSLVSDEDCLSKIATDATSLNILKRITVMRKLADKTPSLQSALHKLESDSELARTDPKLRDLVRESAALMIVPEDLPLMTSEDVPLSLLHPENSLAMEDFLFQRKKHPGALLIMKKGLQAVVPREASRAVLTGQVAYTVLDENGIRHFEPLHVFSALNLSQPTAHRFSMYSCPVVDDNDEDLQTFTGYCNISQNQRITKFGGWARRYSGVLLDRENTRSRMSSYDSTPSYKRYPSRSLSRSRSSCSRSPPKVEDVVVATSDYTAIADDEVSLKAGDIVEVLDTKAALGAKKPRLDPDLDVGETVLLDASAAKHKLAVRPKRNHPKKPAKSGENRSGDRWLVRVVEDVQGGELKTRQGWVPAGLLQETKERDLTALAARRQAVVRELVETEEEFGRDMQQVARRYMKPMDKATTPKAVFDNRELLFSNFRQISEFHNTVLLEGLKYYAGEPRMLGRALLRMEREFDKHVAYCRDEPHAQHLLQEDPDVHKYFQDLADDLGDDKGIAEHLKLPIQRINDYQLLLKELVKYSKRLGDDCTDLQKALELFLGVPNRATDNKFIASIEGYRGNIYKLGRLLTHDWFTVTDAEGKTKERYLFLFKARILICKVKRVADDRSVFVLKDIIKLPEVEVKEVEAEPLKFELRQKSPPHCVTLSAHKEAVKTAWLSEIKQNASDVVALAEHAADDIQLLSPPQVTSPEPPVQKKKREHAEVAQEETGQEVQKRSKVENVEVTEVSTRADSLKQLQAKRKASIETEVAKKISKTEVTEISSTSETKESSVVQKEVTTDLESKLSVTQTSAAETSVTQEKSSGKKDVSKKKLTSKTEDVKVEQASQLQQSEVTESVQTSSVQTSSVQASSEQALSVQASSVQASFQKSSEVTGSVQASSDKSSSIQASSQQSSEVTQSIQTSSVEASSQQSAQSTETTQSTQQSVESQQVDKSATKQSEISEQSVRVEQTAQQTSVRKSSVESATVDTQRTIVSSETTTVSASPTGAASETVVESSQAVTAEETTDGEMTSRYSRSSRLSGEYSSTTRKSSGTGRYESSAYESSGGSSYSRRESGSRIESGSRLESSKYETAGSLEGGVSSRYESKYSSATSRIEGGGSKYGIESSYESKSETSAIEGETTSKIDSIASKYGIGFDSEGRRTSRSGVESSLNAKIESASSKLESSYDSTKNGSSSYESKYSKTALANGSVTSELQATQSISRSASNDGRPVFTKTLEGQNIEPGENASFECSLRESSEAVKVTWLKDNKPLTDRLMDRVNISKKDDGVHKLEVLHCREDDSGLYTARAENVKGNSHCTAQLVVYELTPEERRERNALNAPYFLVALKDTEILLNTYLRFMVRVKGDPNPEVKFYRNGKQIVSTSDSDRVSIVTTFAERGCYELVIADVSAEDAGVYSCKAMNIYGDVETEAKVTVVDDKNIFGELPPGGEGLLAKGEKPSFTWKRDGEPFDPEERFKVLLGDDEDSLALVFQHVRPEDAGMYTCVAKTSTGNISCSAELTVQGAVHELHREPEKPRLQIEHREAVVSSGATAVLELVCKGFPKPSVRFTHDGKVVEADTRHKFLYEDEESFSLVIKNVTSSDAGTYHVTASNELGEDSATIELTVKAAPKIKKKIENQSCTLGMTQTVTIEIEGSPAPEVTFYKDGVEIKSSERVQIVKESNEVYKIIVKDAKLTDSGSYSVIAKNEVSQCSDFWQWHVTSPPRVTKPLGADKVCAEKDTVSFRVETEAEPAPTVTWFKNKTELTESSSVQISSTGTAHTLVIASAARTDSGEYSCEIRNVHGSASDSCSLSVQSAPVITRRLQDTTAKEGDTDVEFTVEVLAFPEPTVKWYHGDVEITEKKSIYSRVDNGSSHKLILREVTAEMSGEYSCKVANDMGSDECQATFTVKRKPRITKSLVDMTVDAGTTLKLEVEVEGCPEPGVKWYKDGKEVNIDARVRIERDTHRLENYHLTVTLVKEEDGGEYEVRAENEMGSVSSKSIVTVHTREIHSRFKREDIVENELEDESKAKQIPLEEDVDTGTKKKADKRKTEAEKAEEKSFWDDDEDGKAKKADVEEVEKPAPAKGRKSVTEPEVAEEKSFWDDVDDDAKNKKPIIEEVEVPAGTKGKKSLTEPEEAEEKSLWDENHNEKDQKPIIEEVDSDSGKQSGKKGKTEPEVIEEVPIDDDLKPTKRKSVKKQSVAEEPLSAESEGRVFETVTTFKTADDGSIVMSKVSSSLSHGAIVTGPAETRTLHKVTSVYCDDDDDYDDFGRRKIIRPNKPHKTSLEVEEIASHSYFLTDLGQYSIPDHIRRGTYGIIEEPQTDSEYETSSRCSKQQYSNRAVSIMSVSEDESSWRNESLSREISIEDLSKSIFDMDENRKVFSKDSYVRQSSFIEDFFTEKGEEESVILKKKTEKVYESDITEKLKNISKEFEEDLDDLENKISDVKNRLLEELVLGPMTNFDNITKNVSETTVERKKKQSSKLFSVEEEVDDDIEELLRRSQRQRSILDDILNEEDAKAPPTIKDSSMKDGNVYESLPLVYTVQAVGSPKPVVRWLHDSKEVKPSARVHITNDGDLYKLEIDAVEMDDGGKWQCEISNDLGKKVQRAELSVTSVNEFRKPIFTTPLEAQRVMQCEPVSMKAVCTADPKPHVSWLLNGVELKPDATILTTESAKETEHGLKECTFTLSIPTGRHADTGIYTIRAKNQYGVGESSARLDILLRPEIEGLRDVTAAPYEETSFVTKIHANPIAEVKWSKDGYAIIPSSRIDVVEDRSSETFQLILKELSVNDAGVYTVTATNEIGETAKQATLTVHTSPPVFTKPLAKQTVSDYDACALTVRCDGVPKPDVIWERDGIVVTDDDNHKVTTDVGGQVDSKLEIEHFSAQDAGKYKVIARSLAGEAACEAAISLAQLPPGFAHRLERQRDVDEGEPLELKCKVDGSPIPTAKWYKDGVELSPSDPHVVQTRLPDGTVKLNIDRVLPTDCGAYKLVITNPNGESSALCAVAVNPNPRKPSFSEELQDATAVVGQPLRLQARVMAYPAPEVKWFKDGLPIRPSQAINFVNQPGGVIGLSIDSVKPEDAGIYSLTVANKLGEIGSKAQVDVTQKERKPAFISDLQPTKVIEGFPVKLEVKVLGHPPPTIKWTHNGKEIIPDGVHIRAVSLPDGSHALLIDKATPEDAGEYACVASNDKGETTSKADLDVVGRNDDSSPQERPRFIHGLRDITGEEGAALAISAPFVGNPVPDVIWTKDGKPLVPSERIQLTCDGKRVGIEINPCEVPDAGLYSVRLVNPLGEDESSGNIAVRKVYQPPSFSQRFTDLQQLPTFDAKFPARVSGVPFPDVTWYKDGVPLRHTDKYNIKRDGDACCLYVRDVTSADRGVYKCVAKNREGEASCEAQLDVVDKIARQQKAEPPSFLKRIGDMEVLRGMSAKFTACATGSPEPDVEWFRNDEKLYPCDRIRIDKESTGLLRLTVSGVDPKTDLGTYKCRIYNPHGEDSCTAQLTYDTLELSQNPRRPLADQYSDFDKMKKTGVPMPLVDKPIISRMTDRHLTLSWKPSIPHAPRFPVTYQVEMCEVPDGDWFTLRTGLRSCVCDVRNLQPFRDYRLRVRVENRLGVSDPSPYAQTQRARLEPDPPKFVPYLAPGIDFRPETSPYFPKDFDIERPPHDGYSQAPRFLRQEHDSQYGVKGHNCNLFWFVYGYPKPKMTYFFNDEPVEIGGRYDWSYTRNGQATLFINKMMDRDVGWYEAVATNEHGQARQRVRLEIAEYPYFIRRPEESVALERKTVRLEARVGGVPYPDIKWYKDWQPLAASARTKIQFIEPDTTVLIINECLLKDEGLYSVSARNVAGSVSSSAMLHVEEAEDAYLSRIREHPPRIKPSSAPLGDLFDLGDELGRGVQGVVYHAAERLTGRNYAAKIMHGHSELKPFMKNELDIMNLLNDRHLVRLHAAHEHQHTLALVTELAAGGELVRDRLLRSAGYSEREVAGYVRQLLRGLKHMHDNNVAHLGLTIGELLLSHAGSDELKICDFGLSRRILFNQLAALRYGMPEYVAPEVARGEAVSYGADMWSVGIITYILLSGHSPFRGANDRETLTRVQEGKWDWHDEEWWSRLSSESRDFISSLLRVNWHDRLDINAALAHPWLNLADKIYQDEYLITTDRLRNYYNLYRDWTANAQCRTWFRRRPLEGAFDHPSKMVYPPGETYTPEASPERDPGGREAGPWDITYKQWDHPDWEVSATSESHYQNGPDTYLLQLRDTAFPVRLREYMKVACNRSPGYSLNVHDTYDPRTPIIRERRRFTDIMDEEIDDERRERINNYGADATARRLRHELGARLDSYAEAEAIIEAKKDGQLPFFREKPQLLPIREGEPAQLTCLAVGDPKPSVTWFKNDLVIAEGQRISITEDEEGRSTLTLQPAMHHDIGFYKVVARNKVGQTVARTRIVEATNPDAPDSPTDQEVSDTEVLLRWKQPKYDGNSPVLCYSLQYKEGDKVEWQDVARNIDHEFYVVRDLKPDTSYQFRLSSRNRIGWSDKGVPTKLIKTQVAGAPKIEVTKAMKHLQQITESGQDINLDETKPKLDYSTETNNIEWDSSDAFTERYSFISELGRGRFSIVVKGVDKRTDSVVVAKILENRPETEVQIQREFECLRRLRHERISNLLAAYQAPGSPVSALILEKLQGADVLTYLSSRHDYTEQMVATIVTQILDGLQYLHWRGYCHLDLQPDNVVMASVRSIQVKLVDFGSAHKVTKLGTSVPQVGELEYKAPEIVSDEPAYPQTDIWSLGVLTYVLLSGVSPFRGADDAETKQNIAFVRYRFEHLYKEITQEATRFLMFLFKKVPLKRPSAEECYEHRWLTQSDFMHKKRERAVFLGHRLKAFSDEYHEKKAQSASQADSAAAAFGSTGPRHLTRSNSIQDELQTTFSS